LEDSYFRNNADLGTGLLMANLAITSPHFFALRACLATPFSLQFLNCWCNFRIPTAKLASGFLYPAKD
jgi:hypothetical protein